MRAVKQAGYRISTEHFGSVLGVVVRELLDKWEFTIYSYSFQTCRYMLVLIRLL